MPPKRKAPSRKKKETVVVEEPPVEPVVEEPVAATTHQEADPEPPVLPSTEATVPTPVEPPAEEPSVAATSGSVDVSDAMEVDLPSSELPGPSMTMEERQARMQELRARLRTTAQANRKDLVEESTKQKTSARDVARLEKQRRVAETMREKYDAEERGEDVDRKKNWEYSIEENDEWEKRQARKKRRSNFEFNDYEDAARRRYKKDVDMLKPDIKVYQEQKAAATGSSTSAVAAHQNLYRDANTLVYADHKPSEDAIDRVASKMNADIDRRRNFSKTRVNEQEGDITYINEANKVFNKKIERYYNKYTSEIRANFERGTAL